jgi:predicted ATP-dependent endonuclease of OLD family/transcription elongation factor Elf1
MGMREFSPFGVKSIEVKFNCNNCGHEVISEEIGVPSPDYSADNHSDSQRENDGYAVCPNCGKDYEVYVYTSLGGGDVDVLDIEDDDIIEIIEHDEQYDADDEIYPQEPEEDIKQIYTGFKIISLEIKDWYVLKKININFEDGVNVLIGENGSGKSSVIECLALIFGHLHKYFIEGDKKALYIKNYVITFESQNAETGLWHSIKIDSLDNDYFNPQIIIDRNRIEVSGSSELIKKLLPTKIGLYYAGITDRLQELSFHFEEKYRKWITNEKNQATLYPLNIPSTRPFLYVRKEHLGIMLLCLLISKNKENKDSLNNEFGIDISSSEVEFIFKKPYWAKDSVDKIWGASDLARQFISLLIEYTDKKDVTEKEIRITHNYVYLKDEFCRMFQNNTETNIFDILDFLLYNDLLDSINIIWKNKKDDSIELDHLSEGEKQLITTMSFQLLWMNQKGFLLFDEPDTFLHPNWQESFIKNLIKQAKYNQYIIATHSPQLINNNFEGQLFILDRGKIIEHSNNFYGRDVNSILTHYMNAQNRPIEIYEIINKITSEIASKNYNIAKTKLNELRNIVSENDAEYIRLSTKLNFLAK